jgi:hypothetical protein
LLLKYLEVKYRVLSLSVSVSLSFFLSPGSHYRIIQDSLQNAVTGTPIQEDMQSSSKKNSSPTLVVKRSSSVLEVWKKGILHLKTFQTGVSKGKVPCYISQHPLLPKLPFKEISFSL